MTFKNNGVYRRQGEEVQDCWGTPSDLFPSIDAKLGPFDLDACAEPWSAKATEHLGVQSDGSFREGLNLPWNGWRIFCNPPYSELESWAKKANQEASRGKFIVMLILVRSDRWSWHNHIKGASEIWFFRGAIKFERPPWDPRPVTSSCPIPACLVIWDPEHSGPQITKYFEWKTGGLIVPKEPKTRIERMFPGIDLRKRGPQYLPESEIAARKFTSADANPISIECPVCKSPKWHTCDLSVVGAIDHKVAMHGERWVESKKAADDCINMLRNEQHHFMILGFNDWTDSVVRARFDDNDGDYFEYDYDCPNCGVERGEICVSLSPGRQGLIRGWVHRARFDAAEIDYVSIYGEDHE